MSPWKYSIEDDDYEERGQEWWESLKGPDPSAEQICAAGGHSPYPSDSSPSCYCGCKEYNGLERAQNGLRAKFE